MIELVSTVFKEASTIIVCTFVLLRTRSEIFFHASRYSILVEF